MSGTTGNAKKGYNREQDQCSEDHGEGDNQIANFLPSSPKGHSSKGIFDADVLSKVEYIFS